MTHMNIKKLVLLFFVVGFLGTSVAHADTVVTLRLDNTTPNFTQSGVYVYPYNFSIDGSTTFTPLICDDFNDEVYINEHWTANVYTMADILEHGKGQMTPVSGSLGFSQGRNKTYLEAAYLYQKLLSLPLNHDDAANYNFAIWALFANNTGYNTNATILGLISDADTHTVFANNAAAENAFADLRFYTPVADGNYVLGNGQLTTHLPQEYIGRVPEPATLALLGTGLLALGLVMRRRVQHPKS